MELVWFKKDLRLRDHTPLMKAAQEARRKGTSIALVFLIEPSLIQGPDSDARHLLFQKQSVQSINKRLAPYNLRVQIFREEAIEFFRRIVVEHSFIQVYSHREVGNALSEYRDSRIESFFQRAGLTWFEAAQENWHSRVAKFDPRGLSQQLLSGWEEPLAQEANKDRQIGGEEESTFLLQQFMNERLPHYRESMGHPLLASAGCSRLSPYFSWGNLSEREVWQKISAQRITPEILLDQRAFKARLHWREHFIQRFAQNPSMETKNLNHAFDGIRQEIEPEKIRRWENGETGFPIIDASLRCLRTTGFLHFRFRALITSFLTHHLWQPWQSGAHFLARQFLDYEPGIHYNQLQMQAGTIGINPVRVIDPTNFSIEQDPNGDYIHKWLPELRKVPAPYVHTPWALTPMEELEYHCQVGKDYPQRIVMTELSGPRARKILEAVRTSPESQAELERLSHPG